MLRRLTVENFVLIDRLDIEFDGGLNIITGETGAGKSILLGALGLLLGARAEQGALQDAGKNCVVEGLFDIGGYGLETFFAENDLDWSPSVEVRRIISPSGKSRAFIGDQPVQLSQLKELGVRLIDIHSQHQNLMLAADGFRLGILDSVARNAELKGRYAAVWDELQHTAKLLAALREKAASDLRDRDYISHQYEQLAAARLKEGELEELELLQGELAHAGQIQEALGLAAELLDGEENGVLTKLKTAAQAVSHTAAYYPKAAGIQERLASALVELRDLEGEITSEAQRVDTDPARLQSIDDRLSLIYSLQKKHGVSDVVALIELRDGYAARLNLMESADGAISETEEALARHNAAASALADRLHESRAGAAAELKNHVESILARLGMPGAQLTAEIDMSAELKASGWDTVRFMFAAGKDLTPGPAEKIASGGEISRLMLALKSLVAERSMLPTIIFDEIDTGVSGRIADAMGEIICSMAASMQVVNITHLPQVASKGLTHFVVYKEATAMGTRSRIRQLTGAERVEEIARMLSGSSVTEAAMAQARLLLGL